MVGEFDLDRAVVEEFGGSFAADLVAFVGSGPAKPIESRAYSTSRPASMAPKAISPPCAVIVSVAGPHEIEVSAIPDIGLDDPPPADQSAVRRGLHAAAPGAWAGGPDCRRRRRR